MRVQSVVAATAVYAATAAAQKSPVSSSVYQAIQHYTQYASAAYSEDCPKPPFGSEIVSTVNSTSTDGKAYVFADQSANEVVLSFRGSAFPKNLDTDFFFALDPLSINGLSCSGCQLHQGFQSMWNSMRSDVTDAVKSALSSNSGAKLVVTGHSLGGALTSLASASFAQAGMKPTVYSFGEPRNGNAAWSSYVDSLISPSDYYRITHSNDGVPTIPPTSFGYKHHGTEYWESGNSQSSTYNCGTGENTQCNAAQDFGSNPINGAHIQYPGTFLASVLNNPACGYVNP